MFPWADLQADSASPSKNFLTTYQSDFRPMKDRLPWPRTRPEVRPAPGFSGSRQTKSETWPVFFQHFYKTTDGSRSSQNPSGSLFPFLPSFGSSAGGFGSTLTEASVQEAGVAMEPGLSFGAGNRVNTSQQQPEFGVQYQEGVILLWQNADPFSCNEVLRVLGQEAGPQFLPVVSGPFIRPDAETCQNHLRSPVRTFNLWEQTPERPAGYFETQDVPPRISQPPVGGQQRHSWTRPDRKLPLTEYQARFGAQWVRPQIQTSLQREP